MPWKSIKNYQYKPNAPLVNSDTGIPQRDGIDLILALYDRTGSGMGSPNQVTTEPIQANGNTAAEATLLNMDWNEVVGANGTGVILPVAILVPGADTVVLNGGSAPVNVYPPSNDVQIDNLGNGNPYSLSNGLKVTFQCWSATQIRSD